MTTVSNQTSHSLATGVDECAEVPSGKVPGGNLGASPDINSYLHKIKAVDSPKCPHCQVEETVAHYLLQCRHYNQQHILHLSLNRTPLNLHTLLGNPKFTVWLLHYVRATKHLTQYKDFVAEDLSSASLSGDAPRFPPGIFPSGTTPRVKHPLGAIPHGIHPQHIRQLLWPESGRFGWRQWSSGGEHVANIPSFALTDESPDASEATAPESPSQQPLGIPYGNLPAMTTEADHLNTLELTLAEERLKTEWIENQLQQLIELLNPARAATEPTPPGNAPSVQVMDEDTPSEVSTGRGFQV
ncbi:hypothetical protein M422DRAFT_270750 [Sphaerobolus stellatus SS14]|uniref:Reverse transcriptase zinc-binding domain-containing protein n=1 Tax=Sphaerobolus stellatus (strain SS14) TaxID=990650 RepID=A0A0C9U1R1_SPHS4|nr:hypothetical protein M422DRAFT_270750 [Sphaerobolus stellatus SS14]